MADSEFFRGVTAITADELKSALKRQTPGEYTLLDVRQPDEYQQSHLPGALLIPLGELRDRIDENDPTRTVYSY